MAITIRGKLKDIRSAENKIDDAIKHIEKLGYNIQGIALATATATDRKYPKLNSIFSVHAKSAVNNAKAVGESLEGVKTALKATRTLFMRQLKKKGEVEPEEKD